GADGVMIGRGACGRPWFLGQAVEFLATGRRLPDPPIAEQYAILRGHYIDMLAHYGRDTAVRIGRKHVCWYTKGLPGSAEFRAEINRIADADRVLDARDALAELGFRVAGESPGRHLPPMVREDRWEWTGNYFASDLPIAVELHYELWDEAAEYIAAPGAGDFWERRVRVAFEGRSLPVLAPPDALGFACLHLLMHILHGDLRPQRAWEIAGFLHARRSDGAFWRLWRSLHAPPLRRLEAVIFDLAAGWFGAALSPAAEEEIGRLPGDVRLWLDRYGLSPLEGLFHPRKDEIWLHLALLDSAREKRAVFLRRTFPGLRRQGGTGGTACPNNPAYSARLRAMFLAARLQHHLRALFPTLLGGIRWRWRRNRLDRSFLRFQMAASLYGFGVVIFVVLHNLFLLSIGFREGFLGEVAGITTLGTVAGSLPAAALARRVGLRAALLVAMLGAAAACFARAWSGSASWQLGAAFLSGLFFSGWAVVYSPAIAALSDEDNRPFAFSISASVGMTVCSLGGLAAGALPAFLQRHFQTAGVSASERGALFLASGLICLASMAALRLRFPKPLAAEAGVRPRGGFLVPFLAIVSVWAAAVGAFNPLFNSFFAQRLRMSAGRIGVVYSCSQALQAGALLCAPPLLRRLGNGRGIAALQFSAGVALFALAFASAPVPAAAAYICYCCFQYMTEPGVFSMLMGGVAAGERSGASALYCTATSLAAALAAWLGGAAISRFGYSPVLIAAAAAALVCAALSMRFLR
ncbi:MAG: tRNA-dihydrouridine synthase, partial [Acidobacteriia bacterium]|nr:tRNA-dihydrouridine synthase [Terriglobia bacterium]